MADEKYPHGTVCWNELVTRDMGRAEKFYTKLLGWKAVDSGMPGMKYTVFKAGDKQAGGMMAMPARTPPDSGHTNPERQSQGCLFEISRTGAMRLPYREPLTTARRNITAERGRAHRGPFLHHPGPRRSRGLIGHLRLVSDQKRISTYRERPNRRQLLPCPCVTHIISCRAHL